MTFNRGWIPATGQRWKLLVLYVLSLMGIVITVGALIPSFGRVVIQDHVLYLFLCGMYFPIWISWIALAVRCPKCNRRTGWWYLQNTGVTEWFTAFVRARRCPVCGYEGEPRVVNERSVDESKIDER